MYCKKEKAKQTAPIQYTKKKDPMLLLYYTDICKKKQQKNKVVRTCVFFSVNPVWREEGSPVNVNVSFRVHYQAVNRTLTK